MQLQCLLDPFIDPRFDLTRDLGTRRRILGLGGSAMPCIGLAFTPWFARTPALL